MRPPRPSPIRPVREPPVSLRPPAPPAAHMDPQPASEAHRTGCMGRIRPWQVALALGLLHLGLVVLAIMPRPHEGGDNAAYLALAQSLRENGSYRELWDPAARTHTQYPPGWPLLLAGAMSAGLGPWAGFKVLAALFSAAAVALSYLWARRASTPGTALAIGVLLAAGTGIVETGGWELSDPAFWAFTMLALLAFARLQIDGIAAPVPAPASQRSRWRALRGPVAIAAVATLLAGATRTAGLPLVMAGGAWLLWRRQWKQLATFALVIAPFAAAWWVHGRTAGGPGYASHLWYLNPYRPGDGTVGIAGLLARIARNAAEYTTEQLPYLLTGVRTGLPANALGTAVLLLGLAGWGMRMRRPGAAELWLPLYLGVVLLWPAEWATERFLLPAVPLILLCAAEPLRLLGSRVSRTALVGTVATGIVVLASMPPLAALVRDTAECRAAYTEQNRYPCLKQPWTDFLQLAQALRGALPADAAVLSRKPTLFWAGSGYPSRVYPFTNRPDSLFATAREAGARYVVLDHMDAVSPLYLAPVLARRPQAFCMMASLGPGRVALLGILPGAEQMPDTPSASTRGAAGARFARCGPEFWRLRARPGPRGGPGLRARPPAR